MGVMLALVLLGASAEASLAPKHRDNLAAALEVLSDGPQPEAAIVVRTLLRRQKYESTDFREFFTFFFERHLLTPELYRHLSRLILHAPSSRTRENLQEAIAPVLADGIESIFRKHLPSHLGPTLERSPAIFAHLRLSMQLLGRIAYGDQLSRASRIALYNQLVALIASYPRVLRKDVTIDTWRQPNLAAVRAHLYKNLRDLQSPFDPVAFVSDTGFWGRYAELVRDHGVIVLDNNGFDEEQLGVIHELLALLPSGLHQTTHISQHDLLRNKSASGVEVRFEGSLGVNIFAFRVGDLIRNQFPSDVRPVRISTFCAVLQHELNHVVDASTIWKDRTLRRRERELVAQAGANPLAYLRSMIREGYFTKHPQEFFASISNQYFADSSHTLTLALRRLERGWSEPINQFLFFADVYSQSGSSTLFFEQDGSCHYSATEVPIGRNANGHVDRILWQGTELHFELDAAGNVVR
jgi:hypothetical protein